MKAAGGAPNLDFSLRLSAYLRVLCVEIAINAEIAEIRRGPQRITYPFDANAPIEP